MKANTSKIYHAAIYLRLSREDGDVAEGSRLESNSISNQDGICQGVFLQKLQIVQ